ncbi:hypothetical protein GCM10027566_32220 [Arachidicoccus ginsenosidivorans]|jgi:DUF4097 and DUF4098 domain-containing protein YvlB|uniref:DUF4097 domain-containing protein n=1 Tax=Arachidicoccus ginsenosidivorans TaxID=496057 RepID=A0A5B8VMF9_9BACT|nr:DUF4097 family beta strand repeat-containing protein [Arachidicoccus ginsenosidivorans]QEC71438.1 DUF4097 domain-containing protein [Arachidicoccus ginsenosidivorans]
MKKRILAITTLAFLLGASCVQANNGSDNGDGLSISSVLQKDNFRSVSKKQFDASQVKSMDVRTVSADVDVMGDATDKATVEMLAKGPNNKSLSESEIKERLEKYYDITTELNGSQLTVKVEFKTKHIGNNQGLRLRFILHTPSAADANIKSVSGDVELTRAGQVNISTTSGDIELGHLSGDAVTASVSGDIQVSSVGGSFSGSTTSGDIKAGKVGALMKAGSVSGDIQIVAGKLGQDVKMKTVSGDVDLKIKNNAGMDLHLNTLSGDMNLNGLGAINYSTKSKRKVVAQVNGGGKELDIETVSGDIHISQS